MNSNQTEMLFSSILVIAHPDDEILWFSSIVEKVDEILFCFHDYPALPALGSGRKKVLAEYPLSNISSLGIEESGSFSGADWSNPAESPGGMALTQNRAIEQCYRNTYHLLEKQLTEKLRGYHNVFTHNPWGEYGHEDHVQIYRAIRAVQQQHPFRLWFSNYASNRSAKMMFNHISGFGTEYISLPTNPELAQKIAELYKKHGCWTWYDDYRWFDQECFIRDDHLDRSGKSHGHIFPVNMLKTDFPDRPPEKPGKLSKAGKKIRSRLFKRNRKE